MEGYEFEMFERLVMAIEQLTELFRYHLEPPATEEDILKMKLQQQKEV